MIEIDGTVLRFKKNRIVCDVYDLHLDLNQIEIKYQRGDYTFEEKYQFLALIGYSVDGLIEKALQDVAYRRDAGEDQ